MQLLFHDMDIYYFKNEKHNWGEIEDNLIRYITPERKHRIAYLHKDSDKQLSLYVEILCRYAVGVTLNCSPNEIKIKKTERGKPYVLPHKNGSIKISLSHSGDYVVCAIASENIGVDIEKIKEFPFEIIELVFDVSEREYIDKAQDKQKASYMLWTRKEALLKKEGLGLIDEIKQFNVLKSNSNNLFQTIQIHNHILTVCSNLKEKVKFHEVSIDMIKEIFYI